MKRTLDNDSEPINKKRKCTENNGYTAYSYILVIIDMQTKFNSSNDKNTISEVNKLILQAKTDKAFIVIAQYMNFGKTHKEFNTLVKKYKPHAYAIANQCDKSRAIETKLLSHRARAPFIKVCGVNTDACVQSTVKGLCKIIMPDMKIQVVKNACNACCNVCHRNGINIMSKLPNVVVI